MAPLGADRAREPYAYTFRPPRPADAAAIWHLVRETRTLESNSGYAYVLVCSHFARTSVVAEKDREICGFVAAYRPPTEPESVFVWQVGVGSEHRREGIALEMLLRVCRQDDCRDARFLLATVDPANQASARLFRAFAHQRRSGVCVEPGFAAALFPEDGHADEQLLRIGPLCAEEGES